MQKSSKSSASFFLIPSGVNISAKNETIEFEFDKTKITLDKIKKVLEKDNYTISEL